MIQKKIKIVAVAHWSPISGALPLSSSGALPWLQWRTALWSPTILAVAHQALQQWRTSTRSSGARPHAAVAQHLAEAVAHPKI
jgi:hypothetical protein